MDNTAITISLDGMGGDFGPGVVVPAAVNFSRHFPAIKLVITGDEVILRNKLAELDNPANIFILHATQVVGSNEPPSSALRSKKDSSMRVAINLVKEGQAQACVSAGNTGALMATARFVLKTLPGVDRPAICTTLPTIKGHIHVLDLGANVEASAQGLFEFAVMGSALVSAVENKAHPTIGLLNIGEEEIKGNDGVKQAAKLLADSELNYIGYVEGDGIYYGAADVVVCDGFVGNVMLKTSEGVAKMFGYYMKQSFKQNIMTKLLGLMVKPVLKPFRKKIDPREYNGASFLGLNGIVVKSHGGADIYSFEQAIVVAMREVEENVPSRITQSLELQLLEKQAC